MESETFMQPGRRECAWGAALNGILVHERALGVWSAHAIVSAGYG